MRKPKKKYIIVIGLFCFILLSVSFNNCVETLPIKGITKKSTNANILSSKQEPQNPSKCLENKADGMESLENTQYNGQLGEAVLRGNIERAREALEKGASVNYIDGGTQSFSNLMWAILKGHIDIVRLLIEWCVNVNYQDSVFGDTALHVVSGGDRLLVDGIPVDFSTRRKIVGWLVEAGADVNLRNKAGNTAFTLAAGNNESEPGKNNDRSSILGYLLEAGADVNLQNNSGMTALMKVSLAGLLKRAWILTNARADVNIQDNNGRTALIWLLDIDSPAHFYNNYHDSMDEKEKEKETIHLVDGIVKDLLEAGANVNLRDNDGKTALTYAKNFKMEFGGLLSLSSAWTVVSRLKEAGARE